MRRHRTHDHRTIPPVETVERAARIDREGREESRFNLLAEAARAVQRGDGAVECDQVDPVSGKAVALGFRGVDRAEAVDRDAEYSAELRRPTAGARFRGQS